MKSQKEVWSEEHLTQKTFTRIHSNKPSGPIPGFIKYIKKQGYLPRLIKVLDLGCGKGRNSIWVASQGLSITGVDFAPEAIDEAIKRANGRFNNLKFKVVDLTEKWPYRDDSFLAVMDCNTTICIPSPGRQNSVTEAFRVLRPGGFYLFYGVGRTSSVNKSPGSEPNSTIFTGSGKFEKQYTEKELRSTYKDFKIMRLEMRIGSDLIEGKNITYSMWVGLFQKPIH